MIAYLSGKVLEKGGDFAILLAGPIGYKVMVSDDLLARLQVGSEASLYIHEAVREDSRDLFGFASFPQNLS